MAIEAGMARWLRREGSRARHDGEPTREAALHVHLEHATSRNRRFPRDGCFCGERTQRGGGTADPYLDLTWVG